eukprot:843756_1
MVTAALEEFKENAADEIPETVMDALKDEVPGGLGEEIKEGMEEVYEAWVEWEYDTGKLSEICIETSKGKKYICCEFDGSIKCVDHDEKDFMTVFESVPYKDGGSGGYVALKSRLNGRYLSVDEDGNVRAVWDECYFSVKSQANDKYSFISDDGMYLYFDEKDMKIKG